jgi:hypothetical protein
MINWQNLMPLFQKGASSAQGVFGGMPDYIRKMGNQGQQAGQMPAQPAEKTPWMQQKGLGGLERGDLILAGMGMLSGKNFQEGLGNASGTLYGSIERQREQSEKQKQSAALLKYMTANGKMAPEAAAALAEFGPQVAIGQMNRAEDVATDEARYGDEKDFRERQWKRDEQRYETDQEWRQRLYDREGEWRGEDVAHRDRVQSFNETDANRTFGLNARKASGSGTRYRSEDELAAAGYPAGAVVQVDAQGEDSVRYKPEQEYTAGQKNKYINDAAQLEAYDATLQEYLALVDKVGLKKIYSPDDPDVAKLEAMQQSLSFGAKDLFQLGVLSKDDYEAINRIIPDATGFEVLLKNKKSFMASAQPLEDYIQRAYNAVPEQFRSQGSAQTANLEQPSPVASSVPAVGTEEDGFVFMGGDPANPNNWKKKEGGDFRFFNTPGVQ